ncbi:MAG: phosphoglucomutase/phosphomannomutase family protein [Elusimicrobia bacterium]|nr:phosphoglucomutase/phosphomannomutase family protein [Elusimicrobiota bacterium]
MTITTTPIKFGTDGWRGIMARDFTSSNVRTVAQAISEFVKGRPKLKGIPIVVGYDRRFGSPSFAEEIACILKGNRLNPVLLEEVLPTPAISYLTHRNTGLGIMVTASHNPASYNGIKIKMEGRAVPEAVTKEVESLLNKGSIAKEGSPNRKSFKDVYLSYLRSKIPPAAIARKLNRPAVIDYMYGCAAGLLEEVLPSKKLIPLHTKHDPLFGGLHPEPIEKYLTELMESVRKNKAIIGIALDGDADRIGLVDDKGQYLTPCQVFPLLLQYMIEQKKLKGKIVQSVSMGYLSSRIAKAYGLPFEEVPVGFKHIAEKILTENAVMGGEESGGYAWKGVLPERDGLLTALLFLEMLTETRKTPSQLYQAIEKKYGASYFVRKDFRLHKPIPDKNVFAEKLKKKLPKKILSSVIQDVKTMDGIKIILEKDHWLLLRPSGTEPLIRTYAETDSLKKTNELLEAGAKMIKQLI